jgi:hypothetical protein
VWFAIVARHYLANRRFVELSAAYRPGERPECLDNVEAVLRTLAGNRPGPGTVGYEGCANARIEVIEDAILEMEPAEGLRQLLSHDSRDFSSLFFRPATAR